MFQIYAKTPLCSEYAVNYNGIAFDGCYYYLTAQQDHLIWQFDKNFQVINSFVTEQNYTAICYDNQEQCFWAAASQCLQRLFKLNLCLKEMEEIALQSIPQEITGIAYCNHQNSLLLSYGDTIIHMDKQCPENLIELENCPDNLITGVTSLHPYYLYHFTDECQHFHIINEDGCLLADLSAPQGYDTKQVLYLGRQGEFDYFQLLAVNTAGAPYILTGKTDKKMLPNLSNDDEINWACTHNCPDNCEECCSPPPICTFWNSCSEVLESIALVETSLAHILNAEGEKIQKAIATSCCLEEIMEVNQEVVRTIIYVTNLEQVLYSKLDAVQRLHQTTLQQWDSPYCNPCHYCNPCPSCSPPTNTCE